jgi:Protein of unknown function (DUF1579)
MADARPAALDRLEAFIGRWITEGETVARPGVPSVPIVASDVYQWMPGRRFVMHPAYGRMGDIDVGGLEVIGHDPETDQFRTYFFAASGEVIQETLSHEGGAWIWRGASVRCTGTFSDDGKTLLARHERSDDGVSWEHSMTVTLRRTD